MGKCKVNGPLAKQRMKILNVMKSFLFLFIAFVLVSCGIPLPQARNYYINESEKTFHIGLDNKIQMNQWFGQTIPNGFVVFEETPQTGYCRYEFTSSDIELDNFGIPFITIPPNHCYGRLSVFEQNNEGRVCKVTVYAINQNNEVIPQTIFSVWVQNP